MQLFYLENPKDEIILSSEESSHAIKVLRKKEGDILNFTDGQGGLIKAVITVADHKKCRLEILSKEQKKKEHNYFLHIAIAPTKNIQRFEWFIEKATEIGIDEITPIICENSERKVIKHERCNRILRSAAKQSLKFHVPKLNKTQSFKEFVNKHFKAKKYIAHCQETDKIELRKENTVEKKIVMIGPEGDFSIDEIEIALLNDFKAISLSKSRLRTETAGIVSVQIINMQS